MMSVGDLPRPLIYGHFQGERSGPNVPGKKDVCGQTGAATIDPSCFTVLSPENLNVEF